eukprot:Nitzschia sp. Nitz4//scaffold341_size29662//15258//16685//NITZ4_008039-RA/size29662-processed-gene-0.27-mRNA-1//-1//CDS//3329548549//2124//frame0
MVGPTFCCDLRAENERLKLELAKAHALIAQQQEQMQSWKQQVNDSSDIVSSHFPVSPKSVCEESTSVSSAEQATCTTDIPSHPIMDPPSSVQVESVTPELLARRFSSLSVPDIVPKYQRPEANTISNDTGSRKQKISKRLTRRLCPSPPLPPTKEDVMSEDDDDEEFSTTESVAYTASVPEIARENTSSTKSALDPPSASVAPSQDYSSRNVDAPGLEPPKRVESPARMGPSTKPAIRYAVRGFPRDGSIDGHSDSDISRHPSPPFNKLTQTIEVESRQLRDAWNQRGLYTGSIDRKTHLPDGFGTMKYHKQAREYVGDWEMGKYHGHGTLTNPQGDVYEGPFIDGIKEGKGANMTYHDGRSFKGRYHLGKMREGHLIFADGSYYEGLLENNKRSGFGLYKFKNGDQYEGQWKNDLMHGRGKMEWNLDGAWYNGDWEFGIQHGTGTEANPDGTIRHQGRFHQGQPVATQRHSTHF